MQIAVLKETEGRGPYCSLVMAVVVVKDVVTFLCFAINIELLQAVISLAFVLPAVSVADWHSCPLDPIMQ